MQINKLLQESFLVLVRKHFKFYNNSTKKNVIFLNFKKKSNTHSWLCNKKWNVQTSSDMNILKCFIKRILNDDPQMGMKWLKTYGDESGHR